MLDLGPFVREGKGLNPGVSNYFRLGLESVA